jgi:hypothetical protein
MNPWMWLVWAMAAAVVLFILSAAVAAVIDGFRKPKPCEQCGHLRGEEVTHP